MNELEKTARYWLKKGVATLPIRWKSKTPEVRSWSEYTDCLPTESEIQRWYITPWHNIAVITGWRNLCILDFDDFGRWEEWQRWAYDHPLAHSVMLTTRICMSARGVHLYCYTGQKGRNWKLRKLDVLCDRKYALTAPSIHPSGAAYTVLQDLTPARIPSIEMLIPEEWMAEAEAERKAMLEDELMREAGESRIRKSEFENEDDLIGKIKSAWRIEDFFPERIPSGGGWFSVRCPLHNDHRPSAGINVDQQIFVCFQHCYGPKPLDVIGLYAKLHGLSNREAILEMRDGK